MADTAEREGSTRRFREPGGTLALWFAVLAGPLAWMLGLNVGYSLVRVACEDASNLALHGVSLATLLLAAAGGRVAWREWRRAGSRPDGEEGGTLARSRFMAALGLLASPFFALAIVAQWVASFVLHPCMGI